MKNVPWVKTLFLTTLVICSLFSCVSLSWATDNNDDIEVSFENLIRWCLTPDVVNAGEDELVEAMQYAQSVWRKSLDVRKKVDYSVLTSIYSRLLSQGVPCEIVTSRGAAQGYYIKGTGDLPLCNGKGRYSIKGSYFSDTSGNIFYADLPDNGKTSSSVPSTSAPTTSENTNTTYVRGPSSDLSLLTPSNELQALKYINQTSTHIANETHRIIELLGDTEKYVFRLYLNVGRFIDGMNSIISGVYRQADLLAGYLPRLDDTVNRLTDIRSASWASVDVENRILSSSTKIGSLLSSVIRNGQIQVNTSPIEARLDKLISMYSKVNSVVLDTASVNGGQITGAVGGELKDVVFWGDTSKVNNTFVSADGVAYTLNDTPVDINGLTLRSVNLGSTIPSYIADDPVLYAGVWQKGTDYIISDTYNASTGEYVQRVDCVDLGSLSWSYVSQGDNSRWVCSSLPAGFLEHDDISTAGPLNSTRLANVSYSSLFYHTSDVCYSHAYGREALCFYSSYLDDASIDVSSRLSGFLLMYPRTPVVASYTPVTIAIPEGSSYISSYNVRITGKYETYDSFTQTADIISGIGRTEALLSSINTAVQNIKSYTSSIKTTTSTISTNVGKVNTALTSVIKDGKFKVDNSDIVTALAEMDNLPGIKTAVEGINIALTSVIADGQVKVDNSAVVAALAKLPNIDTSVASIKSYTSSIKTTTSTISTNVGKVNTALTSVIKDGKLKVDNSDIVTALAELDNLPGIKTAVEGINIALTSVIADGQVKVDNSAVVAALAKLPNIDTSVTSIESYTSSIKTTTSTISTNVGKVNTALTSVIKDGKLKVDNSDIVTALGKLDKLAELPTIKTAVDGVNTTIASVISEGRLKVDNSPVVTWLETINTTLTTNGGHSSTVDLSTIETTLSKICDKLDDAAVNVNNTVVNITNDNDKFNVFYITDVNGETQPITEFAGDLTGASGKLLSLLYRLVFADALGGVDDDFSGFEDFFTSQEPVTATQGVDDTVNEVTDVWAS